MIKKRKSLEAWTISFGDDRYIKDSKNKTYEHTHIERPGSATSISPFEGEQIAVVLKTFEKTLKNLEKDFLDITEENIYDTGDRIQVKRVKDNDIIQTVEKLRLKIVF